MFIRSPNISPGPNGAGAAYAPVDWVRTIRHGVKPDGRPVMIMPSEEYNRLVDADLAAIVAYVGQLPPAAGGKGEVRLPLPVKTLYGAGVVRDASEKINQSLPPGQPESEGVSAAHGAYVVNGCIGCTAPGSPAARARARHSTGRRRPSSRPARAVRSPAIRPPRTSWRC